MYGRMYTYGRSRGGIYGVGREEWHIPGWVSQGGYNPPPSLPGTIKGGERPVLAYQDPRKRREKARSSLSGPMKEGRRARSSLSGPMKEGKRARSSLPEDHEKRRNGPF